MNAVAVSKLRASGKLAVNKLQIVQQKETALAKQARRQLSVTMANGKVATAKIKAETVISNDIYVELLELLELYCELIVSRAGIIDPKQDPGLAKDARLKEAVFTIIYAAPYTDVKELTTLRDLLVHILPKETISEAQEGDIVAEPIKSRIKPEVPSEELVKMYLSEVARAYGINVPGIYEKSTEEPEQGAQGTGSDKAAAEAKPASKPKATNTPHDELWERFNNLK